MEAINEFQGEIDGLSDAISESEAADDLSAAWQTLSAELAASVESLREDGSIAREEIEASLEDFEQQLDELDVEQNVRTAWEELRTNLEQLMTN
jgi:phage-related minor tail protein